MQIIELDNPKNVINALSEGKKLVIFEVDEQKNAQIPLSAVNFHVVQNSDKTDNLITPALNYIDINYNKDIKLTALAALCDLSPSYFSRLFSAATGSSISAYVTNKRLSKACELLVLTTRSIVEIACSVGYVDCGYFYKLFRKTYGCTPVAYRAAHIAVNG